MPVSKKITNIKSQDTDVTRPFTGTTSVMLIVHCLSYHVIGTPIDIIRVFAMQIKWQISTVNNILHENVAPSNDISMMLNSMRGKKWTVGDKCICFIIL